MADRASLEETRRRNLVELLAFGLLFVVTACVLLFVLMNLTWEVVSDDEPGQIPFDQALWFSPDGHETEGRRRMTDDLQKHYLKPGTSAAEVEALLGPSEPGADGLLYYTLRSAKYSVGPAAEYLYIYLDGNGRVERTEVFVRNN